MKRQLVTAAALLALAVRVVCIPPAVIQALS